MSSVKPSKKSWQENWWQLFLPLLTTEAAQARRSPNDFAAFCFTDPAGQLLQQAALHCELQAFLDRHRRALIELPRDHGKSVQICIRLLWELGHHPGLRVKIVCSSDAMAVERCRFLLDAITSNPRLHMVFPQLRPGRPWGVTGFGVEHPANVIGPSVTAFGVGTNSTGSRADLLVCDDIVDVRALRSRADRERVKSFFKENLMNLLEPDGRFWGLFTPWHTDDLNAVLKRNPAYALFRRPIDDDLTPIWPEKWTRERLARRRDEIGSLSFARAYRLACVPEEGVPIRAAWVRFWTEPAAFERVILAVDPAISCKNDADFTALVVLGKTAGNQVHCLEALARRVTMPDLVVLLEEADGRWRPDVILFESNAAFAGIRELFVRQTRFGPKIKPVVQTKDKASRVHAFSVPVENGCFRLKGCGPHQVDPGQQALFDEMTMFPFAEHDDLLDAAASGTAYLLDRPEPRVW